MGRGRIAKACSFCRHNKTKCHVPTGQTSCEKCLQSGQECSLLYNPPQRKGDQLYDVHSLDSSPYETKPHLQPMPNGPLAQLMQTPGLEAGDMRPQEMQPQIVPMGFQPYHHMVNDGRPIMYAQQPAYMVPADNSGMVKMLGRPEPVYNSNGHHPLPQNAVPAHSLQSPALQLPNQPQAPSELQRVTAETQAQLRNYAGPDEKWPKQGEMFMDANTSLFFQASPANILLQSLRPAYTPQIYRRMLVSSLPRSDPANSLVGRGILTKEQCVDLVGHFRRNYNHWVYLPEDVTAEELTDYLLVTSNLLLTACCAVALRYGRSDLRAKSVAEVLEHLKQQVLFERITSQQNKEYLQAMVIIANFSDTLSAGALVFDPWFVSTWGIQHMSHLVSIRKEKSLHMHRLWNHLALAHLHGCISTGRRCMLSPDSVRRSRDILSIPQSNQFDACVLAEISAQFAAYRFFNFQISFEAVYDELRAWRDEWSFLTSVRCIQFADAVYTYVHFLVDMQHALRSIEGQGDIRVDGNALAIAFSRSSTAEIVRHIDELCMVPRSLMQNVSRELFPFVGDLLQQLGMMCGTFILILCSLARARVLDPEQSRQASEAISTVSRLASQFLSISHDPQDPPGNHARALQDLSSRLGLSQ